MDFLNRLNSLDESLHEVASWFVFFPITLCCETQRPFRATTEIAARADLPEKDQ